MNSDFETYEEAYIEACERIDRLKAYCASAAQALEFVSLAGAYNFRYDDLIDKLRKESGDEND
jgi:hypothetical protein